MHVLMEDFVQIFQEIRQSSMATTCKLVIFVSCLDIDALCAAKMISGLLKKDMIQHKTAPVIGFGDMQRRWAEDVDSEVKNVIFIGCGATIDLLDFLGIDEESNDKKIYVIDGHRPWNLDNLFGSKNVMCFLDARADITELKDLQYSYTNYLRLMEEEDNSDNESEINSDAEEINSDYEADKENIDVADDDESVHSGEKRTAEDDIEDEYTKKKPRLKIRTRKDEIDRHRNELESYYSTGSSIATSAASLIYSLVSDMTTPSITDLWFTVVGTTSLDAQHPHLYRLLFPALKTEVLRLNPSANIPSISSNSQATTMTEDSSLYIETDYPFYLLRHWSLYDSMSHSSYVSAKLRLYTEDGRRLMHKMLAKMGISLQDAHERWTHMNLTTKRALPEKLMGIAGHYGMEDIIRQGIVRRFGYKGSVSAGDCVDALSTLLQAGYKVNAISKSGREIKFKEDDFRNGNDFLDGTIEMSRERFWVENFWSAWDALDDIHKMAQGIQMARVLRGCIVVSAKGLLERRLIKDLRKFRLAVLKEGPELEIFSNPLALNQLAVWIAEASAEVSTRSLPLVVASLYPPTNTYLVVGIGPRKTRKDEDDGDEGFNDDSGLTEFNEFGSAFHQVADEINAKVKIDAFESSVIELAKDELSRFLEALTMIGIKY